MRPADVTSPSSFLFLFYTHEYLSACMYVPIEARRGCLVTSNGSHRQLRASIWVLGIKPWAFQEQPVPLITETSLQSLPLLFKMTYCAYFRPFICLSKSQNYLVNFFLKIICDFYWDCIECIEENWHRNQLSLPIHERIHSSLFS